MLPSAAAATSDSSGMKSGPLRMASTSSASSGRPKASRCRSWIWSRSSGCSGRMDQTGAATSSNVVVVMPACSSRLRAIRPVRLISDRSGERPQVAEARHPRPARRRGGCGPSPRSATRPRRRGRTDRRSPARARPRRPPSSGSSHRSSRYGHVEGLAAEDERGAVDPRPSVEVARRREPAGRRSDHAPSAKRPEIVERDGAGRLARRRAPAPPSSVHQHPCRQRSTGRGALRRLIGPGAGLEVVRPRVREPHAVGREPVADPEAAVRADRAARPVARDRHVAAAGKLGPGVGGRIVGPQVVEERRARLAGEDDEADVRPPRPPRVRSGRRARRRARARSTRRSRGRRTRGRRRPSRRRARRRGRRCGRRRSPSRCGPRAPLARRRLERVPGERLRIGRWAGGGADCLGAGDVAVVGRWRR